MTRTIVHIADIHIRSGPSGLARIQEYTAVIRNLLELAKGLAENGGVMTVVAGDVLHDRSALDPHSIRIFKDLFHGLASIGPVVVVQGNHDHHPMHADPFAPHDVLEALFGIACIPNVTYIKDTGYHAITDDVGVGVVTVHDTLPPGEARSAQDAPDIPFPAPKDDGRFHVAMYHGAIEGSRGDSSALGRGSRKGAPVSWFAGYDAIMLGDQHMQQIGCHSVDGATMKRSTDLRRPTWAYPGSLLQQGHGESIWNHGAIIWDIVDGTLKPVHIANPSGFVTLQGGDLLYDGAWQPAEAHVKDPEFPKRVYARLKDDAVDALAVMGQYGVEVVTNNTVRKTQAADTLDASQHVTDEHINWKASMAQRGVDCDAVLEAAMLPSVTETSLKAVADTRNARLEKLARAVRQAGSANRRRLRPISMRWSWLMCFGEGNEVGILGDDGVVLVSARNACGKTACLEVLLLALFGEGFPSRACKDSAAIINVSSPGDAHVQIDFQLEHITYRITRAWSRSTKDASKATCKVAEVALLEGAKETPLCKGRNAVADWVHDNICTVDDFLAGPMLSQGNDGDVLNLSPKEMIGLMERAFGLSGIDALGDLITDAVNAHRQLLSRADAMLNGVDRDAYNQAKRKYKEASSAAEALRKQLAGMPNVPAPAAAEVEAAQADTEKYVDAPEHDPVEHARVQSQLKALRACVLPDRVCENPGPIVEPSAASQLWARYEAVCKAHPYEHKELKLDETLRALLNSSFVDTSKHVERLKRAERQVLNAKAEVDSQRKMLARAEADLKAATEEHAAGAVIQLAERYDALCARWESGSATDRAVMFMEYLTSPLSNHLPPAQQLASLCPPSEAVTDAATFEDALLVFDASRPATGSIARSKVSVADAGVQVSKAREALRESVAELDECFTELAAAKDAVLNVPDKLVLSKVKALKEMNAAEAALAGIDFVKTAAARDEQVLALEMELKVHKRAKKKKHAAAVLEAAELAKQRDEVSKQLANVNLEEATLEWGRCRGAKAVLDDEAALVDAKNRLDLLVDTGVNLRGAKSWLYRACVAPQVQNRVNAVIAKIEPSLQTTVVVTDDGGLVWKIRDGDRGQTVGMGRASGFQRFMVGVAVRVVLGSMLAPCTLQVIDEGFTCLDSAHLQRVPEFLEWLVHTGSVRTVLLVSHLTELRNTVGRIVDMVPGMPFVA